jgi:hypothetical protein
MVTYVPPIASAAPAPISTPPNVVRERFSSHAVAVQSPFEASTAKPAPIASAPAIATSTGPSTRGGDDGAYAGAGTVGGGLSSMCARRPSASRNITARASATVQTSQFFDSIAIGSAAGAAPSVENRRPTLL